MREEDILPTRNHAGLQRPEGAAWFIKCWIKEGRLQLYSLSIRNRPKIGTHRPNRNDPAAKGGTMMVGKQRREAHVFLNTDPRKHERVWREMGPKELHHPSQKHYSNKNCFMAAF